eukprot:TRINITY_DN492_c0_g1_i3.p1 TRINITY_DN492_c0_g1~~TRINITY_DN492_c0_g1_i3.p1  ORF type:complete len:312 (-),score=34.16 TRINITY_DN492_c0_g1_i3:78-1013(-)
MDSTEFVPALLEQCYEWVLPCPGKWKLQGHSRAGERTGFWLSPLNVVLDAGVVTNKNPTAIFITHSHVDHSWNLPWIFGCRTPKLKGYEDLPGRPVFAPSSAWPMLMQLELACHNLSLGSMEDDKIGWGVFEAQRTLPTLVEAGKTLIAQPGLKDVQIEVLKCYHPAETVAFGFCMQSNKLKPEYQGLPGKEIGKLKQSGADIYELKLEPQVVFYGDTNIDAFEKHSEWKKYPVIIVECTLYPMIKNKNKENAYQIGHIHWDAIKPYILENPQNFFVLIHNSQSLKATELTEFEEREMNESGMKNFKIWTG